MSGFYPSLTIYAKVNISSEYMPVNTRTAYEQASAQCVIERLDWTGTIVPLPMDCIVKKILCCIFKIRMQKALGKYD